MFKNIKKQKSNSVVTVAFFNSQRVLDIKGISLFNEIAKRIQNYNCEYKCSIFNTKLYAEDNTE